MNIFRLSILSSLFLFCSLSLLAQDFRGAFHIEHKEFREENDSIHIRFRLQVDSRAVPSCSFMIFEPELTDDNQNRFVFPYIQLTGEERANLNRRWFAICSEKWLSEYETPYLQINVGRYAGDTLEYAFSIPHEEWMDDARLVLKQEAYDCAGELHLYTYTLANRVDMSAREPYAVKPLLAIVAPEDKAKTRSRQGSAFLDFQVNRTNIQTDFRRNPVELGKINEAMLDVMGNSDARITGLFIEGYASPEGGYTNNERLAQGRAVALKDYMRNRYALSDRIFTVRSVAEDWEGLKTRVESNQSLPQRSEILAIIDSNDAPDVKERRLKGLSVYSRLLRDIFPELRRVEYQIDYAVRSYDNIEAKTLAESNPEDLSQAELYRVAESYGKDSPEYMHIITETIPKYYGDDAVALNNAAALLIENNELNTAYRLLDKVRDIPVVWNNLGVVYLLQGNLDEAEKYLSQAHQAGVSEASHNQSELAAKRADEVKRARKR
ncbi:tetratricopeptide repeat protein [Bacteroides sp. 51]|uniref:tetratricopeptide repeat protein n=1 Tax=Bacteroides sp. 51 TaxID=2302938 RepID=UPI0013D1905A|nr:tetratricopeptide repeat protein [Bacteroides sp. 51]NDV80703.1 DUF3868 domain-containing protein [Bacteroides sp. 51]